MNKLITAASFFFLAALASAGDLRALVLNKNGKPVADAVIIARAVSDVSMQKKSPAPVQEQIIQVNKEFVPYVMAIQAGTVVDFPNNDGVKHHVYSFSPAKKFDLPLYSGSSAQPVHFDKPGVIAIGCNIHDWMIGYIYVAETPYFAKTDSAGKAVLKDLPAGQFEVRIWHPDAVESEEKTAQQIAIDESTQAQLTWHSDIKPKVNPRHNAIQEMNSY